MLDAILVIVLIGISVLGVYRGCGRVLFDFLALLGTLVLVSNFFVQASHTLRVVSDDSQNEACVFAILFVFIGAIGLVVANIAYESILLNLGMLDKTLGLVLGAAAAIVLCHVIVKTIAIAHSNSTSPSLVASSRVGDEMLNFTTYHGVITDLYDATGGHREVTVYH